MPDQVIQVQGNGEVEATPDIVVINLGVLSRESEAKLAMQAASETMRAIITAVREQGVSDHGIQTSGLNLHLDQENNVYFVNQQIAVRTEDVGNAGAIPPSDAALFGEAQSRIVVSVHPAGQVAFERLVDSWGISAFQVGETGGDRLHLAHARPRPRTWRGSSIAPIRSTTRFATSATTVMQSALARRTG